MVTFPNAKINLGLRVVRRRPDGYHDLETTFYPVGWTDALEMLPASGGEGIELTLSGRAIISAADDNLVTRAYRLLAEDYPLPPVRAHLHKVLPTGAGLGGGSADASFALRALNELATLNLDDDALEAYARQLGSDCPFFVRNVPVLASGRGDVFQPLDLTLSDYHLLIVYPNVFVSTVEAYGGVHAAVPPDRLRTILESSVASWRERLVNDFERSVFRAHPLLGEIKAALYDAGAVYASMSGSGSALFGLFRTPPPELFTTKPYLVWRGKA
ncbi:MAG: 4-(cytidine 5'-diphospho)-2-C-methyl-D-erythritol kinase [Catalinimonas sp.]